MIITAENTYYAFLDGIKKEAIATVPPGEFNRIINRAQEQWRKQNLF